MRDVNARYLPNDITKAEQQGFFSTDASWFKSESIEFVRRKLLIDKSRIFKYLNADAIAELVQQHLDSRKNRRLLIWFLLNLEESLSCAQ